MSLPDAGHGEDECEEPELPLPEHVASLRTIVSPAAQVFIMKYVT